MKNKIEKQNNRHEIINLTLILLFFMMMVAFRTYDENNFFSTLVCYFFLLVLIIASLKFNFKINYTNSLKKWRVFQVLIISFFFATRIFTDSVLLGHHSFPALDFKQALDYKLILAIVFFNLQDIFFILIITFYLISSRKSFLEKAYNILKIEHYENRMVMLNNQLSPHFLFNSLNDIYAAAVLKNDSTPEMILQLSEILRFIVYDTQKEDIPISLEIKQIERYVAMHQINNPSASNITISVDKKAENIAVLPLLLIPLLENAIKHGNTNDNIANAFISIVITYDEPELTILFINSFKHSENHINRTGIGLKNYNSRLNLKYPNKYKLKETISEDIYETKLILDLSENNFSKAV